MRRRAFEGMVPAGGVEHAQWVVDDVVAGDGVGSFVPTGFAACARVLHPLADGARWADVAPAFLGAGDEPYEYPYDDALFAVEGNLGADAVDALAAALAPATPAGPCHFGLWDGWGWMHRGSMRVVVAGDGTPEAVREAAEVRRRHAEGMGPVWAFVEACPRSADVGGGRPMVLFDGPLDAVGAVGYDAFGQGTLSGQSPQWWWPPDRTWFVATEIDYPWTYVAGPEALVDTVVALPGPEAVRIAPTARW